MIAFCLPNQAALTRRLTWGAIRTGNVKQVGCIGSSRVSPCAESKSYMNQSTLPLSQLENHLWESANILRGPVDAADFKTYIFPLLFFKRICDVWDEEYQEIVDETGDEQLAWFPESHRFQIPEDCHWNDVRDQGEQCRRGPAARDAGDREGQPGHPVRRVRRCPVVEQGAAVGCPAQGPDRALLQAAVRQPATSTRTCSATPTST